MISSCAHQQRRDLRDLQPRRRPPAAPTVPDVFDAPPPTRQRQAVDPVPVARPRTARDQHGGTDARSGARQQTSRSRPRISTAAASTCRRSSTRNLPAPNATVEYFVDGQSRGTFPFYRGARPDAQHQQRHRGRRHRRLDLQRAGPAGQQALQQRAAVQRELHAVEVRGHRAELDDLHRELRVEVNPFDNEAEKGPSSFDRRHRGVVSGHYAPDFLWGFQIGGIGTFESGLPLTPTISINGGALTGTGASSAPQSVNGTGASNRAPFEERNSFRQDRAQDDRHARVEGVQPRRPPADRGAVGSVQRLQLDELHGLRRDQVPRRRARASTPPPTARSSTSPRTRASAVPTSASNTLFGPRDMQLGFKFLW